MKTFTIAIAALMGVGGLIVAAPGGDAKRVDPAVETYENLATAIIALRETEDGLVKGILMHYEAAAQQALHSAETLSGAARREAIEKAAHHITSIANEGDKPIQAIKQRLLKAGHHHHTDADTEEDYLWIDSKEKRKFLAMAQAVARTGADTSSADLKRMREDLSKAFTDAIAAE